MPQNRVKVTKDRTADIQKALADLVSTRILVGIPEEKNARDDGPATNSLIGYVHEKGSPARNIPPRPWLVPGVENAGEQIVGGLTNAGLAAIDGNAARVEQIMNAVGMAARNSVVERISSNIPPPLSPKTIAARRRRSKGSSYRRKATVAADTTTLVDKGELRGAITYVIRKG